MSFAPILEADVKTWTETRDVLIVGFGGAGACAAIEAADNGASVTIFEAASESGGQPSCLQPSCIWVAERRCKKPSAMTTRLMTSTAT